MCPFGLVVEMAVLTRGGEGGNGDTGQHITNLILDILHLGYFIDVSIKSYKTVSRRTQR